MKRNFRIDNLKCLAIFSVILAHMGLPTLLLNIRTYDVVLLFLLAGMNSVSKINPNSINLYPDKNLLWKRCKKLLLPAWGMMFLVWAVVAIGCLILHKEQPSYSLRSLILTLLLSNRGLGFIWIVKIFLLCGICAPFLYCVSLRIKSDFNYTLLIGLVMLLQQLLCWGASFVQQYNCSYCLTVILEDYLVGCSGYIIVSAVGIRLTTSPKTKWLLLLFLLLFLICQISQGSAFAPNAGKYPPTLYYISYGLLVSCALWLIIPNKSNKFIVWVSKNSWNIYLFHIPFYTMTFFMRNWRIRFLIVVSSALITTLLWNKFLGKFNEFIKHKNCHCP